jgi:hypothetical protein
MVIDEPVKANIRVGLLLEELDKLAEETALRYVRLFIQRLVWLQPRWIISMC